MKLFNGKINVLNVEQVSSDSWKLQIRFFDGYMHFTMNDISIGDYVFLNSESDISEEIGLFVVSSIDELANDFITITSDSGLTPMIGDGIICKNEGTSFLPTSLDGLSQQLIDYARNIDLNVFAKEVFDRIDNIDVGGTDFSWHYEENASYLSNTDVRISNVENTYNIDVPEGGLLKTISFTLIDLGEVETIDDDISAYTIFIDFDVNQVFTPNNDFEFVNNRLEAMATIPTVEMVSMDEGEFRVCNVVYPELVNYHTLKFKFVSSVKTDANTLIVKLTF